MNAADDADVRAVRRAAARTAWQVAAVSAGVVVGVLGLAVLYVLDQSRPSELLEPARPGESKIYVDADVVLVALVLLGVVAVVILGLASRGISRRAVAPLGDALRRQRAFVADASHELRTPLSVLDTRVQLLERRLARGEDVTGTIADVRRDTGAMIELVGDLLLLAEAAGTASATDGGADLRAAVLSGVEGPRLLAAGRGVTVESAVENEGRVGLSAVGLRRALVVLVDNAVAHSPDGGVVRVSAVVRDGRAVVRVQDEGPGIVGIEVDRVFDRFAHGPETGQRRGFGIGLSLVRDLAVRHGGRVLVESTSGAGTTMRLELPLLR